MKRIVDLRRSIHYEDNEPIMALKIEIGALKLSFRVNNRLRLQLLEFFSLGQTDEVSLPVEDLFCPTLKLKGRHVDNIDADTFNIRESVNYTAGKEN